MEQAADMGEMKQVEGAASGEGVATAWRGAMG